MNNMYGLDTSDYNDLQYHHKRFKSIDNHNNRPKYSLTKGTKDWQPPSFCHSQQSSTKISPDHKYPVHYKRETSISKAMSQRENRIRRGQSQTIDNEQ
jgi:hypothetical protein